MKSYGLWLFLILVVSGQLLAGCTQEQPEEVAPVRPVRAIRVGDASGLDQSYLPGKARAAQEVDLSFRVDGPLITRPVNVGDEAKANDIVARIDPRDYQVALRNAQGQLEDARAALVRAEAEYKREQNIFKQDPGATSKTAVARKREARDRAKASITSLEATVAAAKDRLSYTYLKAPFSGTIVTTYVENFQSVRAKQPIVRLLDTQRIKFDIDIPERYISYIPGAKNIRVRFDAFPDNEVPAELFEIGTEASRTTRTYRVTLIMDQPQDFQILAGMAGKATGEVKTPDRQQRNDIIIPVTAVFSPEKGTDSYVWVVDDATKQVSRRQVVARRLADAGIVIEQGLKPGEWVATAGVHFLQEGQKVRILGEREG
ncbi:MAG: efflux RND transporter periplasmic adaptor subunit [Acidiferrobacterales bacterium]